MDAEHSRRVLATLLPLFLLHFAVHAQVNNYIVGPQDVLAITLFDQQDLSGKYTVEADGTFTFPLIGRVKAGGMSLRDVEQALRTQLSDGFFKNPQVSVSVEQYRSQRIFVVGEVRTPGPYPLVGDMTLIEALARAGGLSQKSNPKEVILIKRRADGKPELKSANIKELFKTGDLKQDFDIDPGDIVYVSKGFLAHLRDVFSIIAPALDTIESLYIIDDFKNGD